MRQRAVVRGRTGFLLWEIRLETGIPPDKRVEKRHGIPRVEKVWQVAHHWVLGQESSAFRFRADRM